MIFSAVFNYGCQMNEFRPSTRLTTREEQTDAVDVGIGVRLRVGVNGCLGVGADGGLLGVGVNGCCVGIGINGSRLSVRLIGDILERVRIGVCIPFSFFPLRVSLCSPVVVVIVIDILWFVQVAVITAFVWRNISLFLQVEIREWWLYIANIGPGEVFQCVGVVGRYCARRDRGDAVTRAHLLIPFRTKTGEARENGLASEGAGGLVAGGQIEAASLVVAEVEAGGTSALKAADRVPAIGRTADFFVRALVLVHALVPIPMLIESRRTNASEASD